jgi:hypothetical protein
LPFSQRLSFFSRFSLPAAYSLCCAYNLTNTSLADQINTSNANRFGSFGNWRYRYALLKPPEWTSNAKINHILLCHVQQIRLRPL